ncbi:M12 family metallo-peptidase [Sabulilitoribacter multivorans]|uniref:M12 family metallo-peptidase n=1 Tax=Flaviramulus multivorans TaxID=1304750 RepID=A0ABS9IF53_9FLAO|nr:zinc-dependent metalloprotease family protein [Flaviramulus multivorans]MCF7559404.1 M12 family metallo-peptidase [Flaviramulus multivorans]
MKTKLHYVLSMAILLCLFSVNAQNSSFKKVDAVENSQNFTKYHLDKNIVHLFELNMNMLEQSLSKASLRSYSNKGKNTVISLPAVGGKMETFTIFEAPVFSKELSEKYPNIKSYVGVSSNNSGARLRMSISPQGVQTMITYPDNPTVFMEPVLKASNQYVLYSRKDKNAIINAFECKTIDEVNSLFNKSNTALKIDEGGANDQTLQKFRIAISTTSEYTAYHDDGIPGNGDAIADALAAINASLSRVNEVFETDMAVTFELVNATQLIYNDAVNDPYSDANVGVNGAWSSELQSTLTTEIGEAAYDIGHLFGATGGGGNAGCIGCVCTNGSKGSGYTSPADAIPEGDTFDINYVVHEIGHQMGANHTWAFSSEGTGVNSEPGSGTTIMGYAGITGPDDVQTDSDDYFHYQSIKQILDNLSTKSCQTTEGISNSPPSVDAGSDYFIPKGTAYVLRGSATDSNSGDNLTYCWEQIDSGVTDFQNFGPDLPSSSMNRSLPPSSSPDRYIPRLSSVVAGNTIQTNPTLGSDWETVSNVSRNLNWALTVRDRSPASATGGQSSYDTMLITVEDVDPFTVTNPVSWSPGSMQTIEWFVGQTTNATINCQNVNIKLSVDGGVTFPTTIATNTPNDGSFVYSVPIISNTSQARILIEAADNIFYDVSDFDFSISSDPDFFIVETGMNPISCGDTSVTYTFDYVAANGFSDNTVFSASSLPSGSSAVFSPTNLSSSGSFTLTLNGLTTEGDYTFTVTGTSSTTKNISVDLPYYNGLCSSVANTDYETSTTLVLFNTINNASAKPSGYSDYTSISTDINRNESYNLTVNVNTDGAFTTNTKVWIDWNQNCSFGDAGEEYDLGDANDVVNQPTNLSPLSITVPISATLGNTIMRVSTKYKPDGLPTFCDNGFDGEVEDYTLNIMPTLAVEEFGFDNFIVFPNPNKGEFTIKLNSSTSNSIKVNAYDLSGRIIYNNLFKQGGDFNEKISLRHVQSGMYILNVSDGIRASTRKIIVE